MIAIDPGASGGIAKLYSQKHGLSVTKMPPTKREILDFLRKGDSACEVVQTAYLEQLVKFAGRNMPSSAMATYASNHGYIEGVLTTLGYRIVIVPPKKWQKVLGLGTSVGLTKTAWKNKLKNLAEQLYPDIKVTLATADALLILEAAKRGGLG